MENLLDNENIIKWIFIILFILGSNFLNASSKKKKEKEQNSQNPTNSKSFWEIILQQEQKETESSINETKELKKNRIDTINEHFTFTQNIHQNNQDISLKKSEYNSEFLNNKSEEIQNTPYSDFFHDQENIKRAFICSEILKRKYD